MKKQLIKIALLTIFFVAAQNLPAQNPPPPPGGHNLEGNAPTGGGTAPIGSGAVLLISLAVAYGGKKAFDALTQNETKERTPEA